MRIQDQDQLKPNWGFIYMATFQKEIQLVWTKKWSSKESAWFGEPRCNLGSKVASSIVFHYFSLFFTIFHCFSRFFFFTCSWSWNYAWMEDISWMEEDIVESTSNVGMVGFVDPHKVVRNIAFLIFENVRNECV